MGERGTQRNKGNGRAYPTCRKLLSGVARAGADEKVHSSGMIILAPLESGPVPKILF